MRTVITLFGVLLWYHVHAQPASTSHVGQTDTAITDRSLHEALLLYPNPANHMINLSCTACDLVRMPVEIRSMDGRLLRMDVLSTQQQLNVSDLDNGSYRLYLLDLGGVRAHRVFRIAR